MKSLESINLVDLRVVVLNAEGDHPPAIAIICDTMGQIDLGWIETSTAPAAWRATVYHTIAAQIGRVLPVFGFDDIIDHMTSYLDDDDSDEAARQFQIDYNGVTPDEVDETLFPSAVKAARPEWMLRENKVAIRRLPPTLQRPLRALAKVSRALEKERDNMLAWNVDQEEAVERLPDLEDRSYWPPVHIVPFELFKREIDSIGEHGMQCGFNDLIGLCALSDEHVVSSWFASLRAGVAVLRAIQDLLTLDPNQL